MEEWLTRLNEERHNLRAALRWADKTDLEAGLYISGRLQGFWENLNVDEGDALDDRVSPQAGVQTSIPVPKQKPCMRWVCSCSGPRNLHRRPRSLKNA